MGTLNEVLRKIDAENIKHGSPEDITQQLVIAWAGYDCNAIDLILDKKKNIADCYKHIRNMAKKLRLSEVNENPAKEVEWMLDYYGISSEKAREMIESGLMYAVFQKMASPWETSGCHKSITANQQVEKVKGNDTEKVKKQELSVSLDDLLGM